MELLFGLTKLIGIGVYAYSWSLASPETRGSLSTRESGPVRCCAIGGKLPILVGMMPMVPLKVG